MAGTINFIRFNIYSPVRQFEGLLGGFFSLTEVKYRCLTKDFLENILPFAKKLLTSLSVKHKT